MPQTAAPAPRSNDQDFAGLLTSLTKKPPRPEISASAWNDDQLADDIATLSYEQALRTHVRYRPPERDSEPLPTTGTDLRSVRPNTTTLLPAVAPKPAASAQESSLRVLKTASITIRLSEAESEQLHRRADEAGLTVSAYLRSCTLEVETLRAQVKETLAQLRAPQVAAQSKVKAASTAPGPRLWWRRFWSGLLRSRTLQ